VAASPAPANTLGPATPIFPVANLAAALDYYLNVLGFRLDWQHQGGYVASVSRDKCNIFLAEGDQGHAGTWTWIGVNDAAAFEAELRARGAKIRHPATNYSWALELQVEDPDGNVLRFGSDPIKGQPFGEFPDMHGRLWPTV
jgi:catechol 2,3-dioxygenase-like lactoylglutathione lyase family enzyme